MSPDDPNGIVWERDVRIGVAITIPRLSSMAMYCEKWSHSVQLE
jgi:hypothetical protein